MSATVATRAMMQATVGEEGKAGAAVVMRMTAAAVEVVVGTATMDSMATPTTTTMATMRATAVTTPPSRAKPPFAQATPSRSAPPPRSKHSVPLSATPFYPDDQSAIHFYNVSNVFNAVALDVTSWTPRTDQTLGITSLGLATLLESLTGSFPGNASCSPV